MTVLLLAALLGGVSFTFLYDDDAPLLERLACGAPIGLAILGLAGYVLASFLGLGGPSLALAGGCTVAPAFLLLRGRSFPTGGPRPAGPALAALAAILLFLVFDRAMFERPDGLYTGVEHNLGDLPFHLAIVTGFTKGENFPPEHPELAGARLTYPFLVDFVAAQLVRAGASLRSALLAENLVLALAFVGLLYRFTLKVTGDAGAARLAPVLALLSGGFGFWMLAGEARTADGGLLAVLRHLPHDYTITRTGELRWGNVLTTLLIPQRALLLGAPLALLVLRLWWDGVGAPGPDVPRQRRMGAAGILAGLLPLAHTHTYAVLLAMGACLAVLFWRPRAWAAFFGLALLLGLPQVAWLALGTSVHAGHFIGWHLGWDHGDRGVLGFWLFNTGLFLPLLAVALARVVPPRLALFYLPFTLCFLVPNVLKLSPWIWDNIKLLFYWHLASVPLVALLLARMWHAGRWGTALCAACSVVLTLSGAIDVFRVASRQVALRIFDAEGIAFARSALEEIPPRALVLHAPGYDSPVYLSGRRSILGYPGHIWSQGLDAGRREEEIALVYAGGPEAEAILSRYGVDYMVIGPGERSQLRLNEAFLGQYGVVGESGPYRLLQVHPNRSR